MLKSAQLGFFSLVLSASMGLAPVFAGQVSDALGDLLQPPPGPDIIQMSGVVNGPNLRVSVQFAEGTFLQPPGPGTTGVGIYLDTDLNPATGGSGISGGTVDFATIGWEFLTVLQGANDSAIFRYVGPNTNDVMLSGIALSTFTSDSFSITIPLSTIGPTAGTPDDGRMTIKVASFNYIDQPGGPTSGIYDVAPDIGEPALGVFDGDYDFDGKVDDEDYERWVTDYGTAAIPGTGADGNGDGFINAADYVIWRNNNGSVAPDSDAGRGSASRSSVSSFSIAIPEPSALLLILLAGLLGSFCTARPGR